MNCRNQASLGRCALAPSIGWSTWLRAACGPYEAPRRGPTRAVDQAVGHAAETCVMDDVIGPRFCSLGSHWRDHAGIDQ